MRSCEKRWVKVDRWHVECECCHEKRHVARLPRREPDDDEWHPSEHAMFMPPWKARLPNGQLSQWWYGPASESAYDNAVARYEERAGGEAFWDRDEDRKTRGIARYDQRLRMMARAKLVGTPAEQRVVYLRFERGLSVEETALKLGISPNAVNMRIRHLRGRR